MMLSREALLLLLSLALNSIRENPAAAFQTTTTPAFHQRASTTLNLQLIRLRSSFYDDFENFDNDDDDDDEEDDDDAKMMADFKSRMGSLFGDEEINEDDDEDDDDDDDDYLEESAAIGGKTITSVDDLISFANAQSKDTKEEQSTEWAKPLLSKKNSPKEEVFNSLQAGAVLVANPAKFCSDFGGKRNPFAQPSPALLAKFGLTLPPPADLGPDRRADLLPVLVLLEKHPLKGCQAVLLNRRTGYLLGDLEQQQQSSSDDNDSTSSSSSGPPKLGAFMIQPLWFGGTSAGGGNNDGGSTSASGSGGGLDMLHLCPLVDGAKQLTEDGLYWGGDPEQAQDAMTDPSLERVMTGFDFKFFVQSTRWLPEQLEREVGDGTWFVASVSKEVLFKSRDRLGAKRAKPLWTEIMELMGGEYATVRDQLYDDS